MLSLLGDRVNALRIPWFGREPEADARIEDRFWGRAGTPRHAPPRGLAGERDRAAAPHGRARPDPADGHLGREHAAGDLTSRQGFEALARDFPAGQSDPVRVVLDRARTPRPPPSA